MASRLTPKTPDELTPAQREQYERVARARTPGPDGQFGGPFDPWIRSPELAQRAMGFGNFLWERTTVGRRIVELAICATGRFWKSNVEWVAHERMALANGASKETLDAIFAWTKPSNAPADEQLCWEICRELHETRELSRQTYERAVATFGEQGLMEIIGTIGFYSLVSMTLNAFNVPAAVEEQPFPKGE
jgi:4-carboxymuconolactone decarboxylase